MRLKTFCAAALAAALTVGGASAGELTDACVERLEADGRDTSGCSCLEDYIQGDQALIDELTALGEIEDPAARYSSASPGAKAAMDACTRK